MGFGWAYTRGHLLSSLVVFLVVGFAKDIVATVFDATGVVEPWRAFVSGGDVDVCPYFWG